jgi:hypothetical protein
MSHRMIRSRDAVVGGAQNPSEERPDLVREVGGRGVVLGDGDDGRNSDRAEHLGAVVSADLMTSAVASVRNPYPSGVGSVVGGDRFGHGWRPSLGLAVRFP